MTTNLNLHDIQGNIVKGYGRFGFPFARYVFFSIKDSVEGRKFIEQITPLVTTAVPWEKNGDASDGLVRPQATTNIAFTYNGLKQLGLPEKSLHSFPEEFTMGMKARKDILGDNGQSAPEFWDKIWHEDDSVDIWLSINGQTKEYIENRYQKIQGILNNSNGGVVQLSGHKGENGDDDLPYQEAAAVFENDKPTPKEHFGYTDGISNPFFKGSRSNPAYVLGGGKVTNKAPDGLSGWEPLETGEFILGYKDEAQELPDAPFPRLLSYNGTFMVYRKLHENVGSFNGYVKKQAANHPEKNEELIAAKFAGRWRNGAPLSLFPTQKKADEYIAELGAAEKETKKDGNAIERGLAKIKFLKLLSKLVGFSYNDDLAGSKCPVGAHIRRSNPRGSLEYGVKGAFNTPGALVNRRRILRRGLPYGVSNDKTKDDGNHGIIFMTVGASIKRQFEFVQQQWINYGNDFKLANEKDVILGNNDTTSEGVGNGQMTFEAEPNTDKAPHFCSNIPRFVEMRGGDYFFIPSMTALHIISKGIVDPT